jgi:hypothetical protein
MKATPSVMSLQKITMALSVPVWCLFPVSDLEMSPEKKREVSYA